MNGVFLFNDASLIKLFEINFSAGSKIIQTKRNKTFIYMKNIYSKDASVF